MFHMVQDASNKHTFCVRQTSPLLFNILKWITRGHWGLLTDFEQIYLKECTWGSKHCYVSCFFFCFVFFLHEETVCASKNLNAHCFILAFPGFRNFPGSSVFVNYVAQGKFSSH